MARWKPLRRGLKPLSVWESQPQYDSPVTGTALGTGAPPPTAGSSASESESLYLKAAEPISREMREGELQ